MRGKDAGPGGQAGQLDPEGPIAGGREDHGEFRRDATARFYQCSLFSPL